MFTRKKKRPAIQGPDDLDIISAIWILASNDDNPAITYNGVRYRLGLAESFDIKRLIGGRADLFRHGIPSARLETWKEDMRASRHLPSWIRDVEAKERTAIIDALTTDDIFRSQFRSEAGAKRSPIEIIEWGLQHIDRLRKASAEAREQKFRRISGLALPILSMFVALSAVLSGAYLQWKSINIEAKSKEYETTFKLKEEAYTSFMKAVAGTYEAAYRAERPALLQNIDRLETAFYTLEPFLDKEKQQVIWDKYLEFSSMCLDLQRSPNSADREKYHDQYIAYRLYFRTELYGALFRR